MEKDIYKQFIEDIKSLQPKMTDEEEFKRDLLEKIGETHAYNNRLIRIVRVAASILLLLSFGTYIWMEVHTWEQRLLVERQLNNNQMAEPLATPCRQAVEKMMVLLAGAESLPFNNDGVVLSKTHLNQIKNENTELFEMLEKMLVYMKQFYPSDYAAFQAGETLQLSAWQLRKEYDVCNWITNN